MMTTEEKCSNEGYLPEDTSFATRAIHSGYEANDKSMWAIIPPIHLTTTFRQAGPAEPYYHEYSRSGNPSRDILETNLAALDKGKYALCFSSGLGALSVILQLFKSGDHVICMDDVYGGTGRYLRKIADKFQIEVTFDDFCKLQQTIDKITPATKLVWLEVPTNPLMKVVDVEAVVRAVKGKNENIIVVVDNTFLTPYFQKPLSLGADIVVYSLTKYMNGHADVVMGAAVLNDEKIYEELKFLQNAAGVVPSPFDCYLVTRSLRTLKVRMKEHMASGLRVARFLEGHTAVEQVLYPGLMSHPGYSIAKRQWSGCSGVLSFYLKGGIEESKEFLKNLKYFQTAESLGGFESLAEIPSIMTHNSVPLEVKKQLQITDNLIRLSVGLESIDDLLGDLSKALNMAASLKEK